MDYPQQRQSGPGCLSVNRAPGAKRIDSVICYAYNMRLRWP